MSGAESPLDGVLAKVVGDPDYRGRLKSNPRAALKEMDVDIPSSMEIEVVECTPSKLFIALPAAAGGEVELSDAELDSVAAGSYHNANFIANVIGRPIGGKEIGGRFTKEGAVDMKSEGIAGMTEKGHKG